MSKIKISICILIYFFICACSDPVTPLDKLSDDAVILAFGNSLTRGTGAKSGADYPSQLALLSNLTVINEGVPGEVSSQGAIRLPPLLHQHQPDLVILIHGGNDILRKKSRTELKNNLQSMITEVLQRNIQVIILGVPEPGIFLSSAEIYEELANQNNILAELNLLPDILGDNTLKADTVHPNEKGYLRLAEGIYQFLGENGAL